MSDRVAIYPGSFDPPTNGHVDIVERSARLFDRVVVGVGRNLAKKTVFTADERISSMRSSAVKTVFFARLRPTPTTTRSKRRAERSTMST